jgi:hypothetical protein
MENKEEKGRPLKYKTNEELQSAIDEFFALCVPELLTDIEGKAVVDKVGRPVYRLNPPTLTGLALHLGFESRQSIYDYEKRNEAFSYTIKKARLTCENFAERGILSGEVNAAAGIFVLKNYGWTDKQEIEMSGSLKTPITVEVIGVENKDTE